MVVSNALHPERALGLNLVRTSVIAFRAVDKEADLVDNFHNEGKMLG